LETPLTLAQPLLSQLALLQEAARLAHAAEQQDDQDAAADENADEIADQLEIDALNPLQLLGAHGLVVMERLGSELVDQLREVLDLVLDHRQGRGTSFLMNRIDGSMS